MNNDEYKKPNPKIVTKTPFENGMTNTPVWDKADIVKNELEPKLTEVGDLCKKHNIPFYASIIATNTSFGTYNSMNYLEPGAMFGKPNRIQGMFEEILGKTITSHTRDLVKLSVLQAVESVGGTMESFCEFIGIKEFDEIPDRFKDGPEELSQKLEEFMSRDDVDKHCI